MKFKAINFRRVAELMGGELSNDDNHQEVAQNRAGIFKLGDELDCGLEPEGDMVTIKIGNKSIFFRADNIDGHGYLQVFEGVEDE